MTISVVTESNWIVDVALGRHPGSTRMWQLAQDGSLIVNLPAFSTAESIKAIEATQRRWRELAERLRYERHEVERASRMSLDVSPLLLASDLLDVAQDRIE